MARRRDPSDFWAALIVGILFTLLIAWALMLIVGALAPQFGVSYWQTLLVILGLRFIVAALRR